jgi:hypothetical protein
VSRTWANLARAAVWLAGTVLLFVVEPPRVGVGDTATSTVRFVQFALAILIGVVAVAVPGLQRSSRVRSAYAALALLAGGTALLGGYLFLTDRWTCDYPGGPLVVGATYLQAAAEHVARNPGIECQQLLLDFAGQTSSIWPRAELTDRRLGLAGLFTLVVLTLALAAMLVIRAVAGGGARVAREPGQRGARRGGTSVD